MCQDWSGAQRGSMVELIQPWLQTVRQQPPRHSTDRLVHQEVVRVPLQTRTAFLCNHFQVESLFQTPPWPKCFQSINLWVLLEMRNIFLLNNGFCSVYICLLNFSVCTCLQFVYWNILHHPLGYFNLTWAYLLFSFPSLCVVYFYPYFVVISPTFYYHFHVQINQKLR